MYTEADHLQAIAEIEATAGPQWAERFEPGSFGCHELLDRVHMISFMFQQYVIEHEACLQNPDWYQLAGCAVEAMENLYQEIGAAHL